MKSTPRGKKNKMNEKIAILDTNIDDLDGETMGYVIGRLMEEGALDATATPAFGKKNRIVFLLKVICAEKDTERFAELIEEETGTLGVRVSTCERHVGERKAERKKITVFGQEFEAGLKISRHRTKVEFEDLKRIAKELKKPLRAVKEEAYKSI